MRRLALLALPALGAVLLGAKTGPPLMGDWQLWSTPFAQQEVLDQAQIVETRGNHVIAKPGRPVGQVFVPQRSPLLRLEVKVDNRYDPRRGSVKLYRWRGSAARSRAGQVLFEDTVQLAGDIGYRFLSFFPRLAVEPGEALYLEFSADGRGDYGLQAASEKRDRYPDGFVVPRDGRHRKTWDLWFRSFSGPREAKRRFRAHDPELETGSASGRWQPPERRTSRALGGDAPIDRVRRRMEKARRGFGKACTDQLHNASLAEGMLYRSSCAAGRCDEQAAEAVRRVLLNAADARFCRDREGQAACGKQCIPEPDLRFFWLKPPVLAYLWTRGSPRYTRADHAHIRALLVDSAERLWYRREFGVHNRSITLATGYLGLSLLYPDHEKAGEWRAHADAVWQEFRRVDDTLEDSAQYNLLVWMPSVLAYAELAGEERELFADPGFLAIVDRLFEHTAPLGVHPNFGDDSGWAVHPAALAWLMEAAAKHTGDGRYRWLAERVAAYGDSHPRDRRPQEDSLQQSLAFLASAGFSADESIEPTAPREQHELQASVTGEPTRDWSAAAGAPVGRRFVAARSPLVRLQWRVAGDATSARVSLWRWRESREATVARDPLYRSELALPPASGEPLSALPFLELEVGAEYYAEIEPVARALTVRGTREGAWLASWTLSGGGSVVTTRLGTVKVPKQRWEEPPRRRTHVFTEDRVANKLVLRSGYDPDDLHAVVNLLSGYQHGQEELGALVSLVDRGSVLFADGPFPHNQHVKVPDDESGPLLRRYWGGAPSKPGQHAQVTHFRDTRNATVAWLEWDDPGGWGARQERRVLFVKNRFLLVRDRFQLRPGMAASAGPVWHAGDVHPQHGASWFDVFYREPLTNTWKVRNPERYALVWFLPREGRQANAFLERSYLPREGCEDALSGHRVPGRCRAGPPHVLYQRWTGEAQGDTALWFDTLLLPHGSGASPRDVAAGVRVLHASESDVALEVKLGNETWTVVDRAGADAIESAGLDTDARYALVRRAPGSEPYVMTRDATRLVQGDLHFAWPVRTSVERGATLPVGRPRKAK